MQVHPWVDWVVLWSRSFVTRWRLFFYFPDTHMCTSPHTYVLVICILKSALTNRWNCKISEKVLHRKRINAGRGGVKAYPLGVGLVPFAFWNGWGSQLCRCCTDKGREVSTKSEEEGGREGSHALWHSASSPHSVVTAPAACDHRALKAAAATARWRDSCRRASSRPALIEKRGAGAGGGGGEAPCRAATSTDPRRPLGTGTRALDCSDVEILSGAPGVWRQKGKGRSPQRASKDAGCCKRNRGALWKEPIMHWNAFWRRCHYLPPLLLSWKEPARTVLKYSSRAFLSLFLFPLAHDCLLTFPEESQSSQFQLRRQFLIKKQLLLFEWEVPRACCGPLCCDILECLQKLKNKTPKP